MSKDNSPAVREVLALAACTASRAQEKCRAHHTGPWMIELDWFNKTIEMINQGHLKPRGDTVDPDDDEDDSESAIYESSNGIAVIPLAGALMKARSKFGGTSTIDARNAVRAAANDSNVKAILLHIDSPGGTCAGTDALAQDVANANAKKPVYAHIEDMGASAAYWIASQARSITASRGSLVGSLGTRSSIVDSSAAAAQEGLKVLSFSTGEFKAAGLDGTVITDRQAAYFQQIVDDANNHFKAAVAAGRNMPSDHVDSLFDGRVHDAAVAKSLGLIDDVSTLDAAIAAIFQETTTMNAEEFKQYASANPKDSTVADLLFQGHQAGASEAKATERNRAKAIADACGDNHKLAVKFILAGQDAEAAKIAAESIAESKTAAVGSTESNSKELADAKAEIERLKSIASEPGQPAASTRPGPEKPKQTQATPDNAEAVAKEDWAAMSAGQKSEWFDENTYVTYRIAEAKGQIGTGAKR